MFVDSQISLNEESSEIIDKSYSFRSASEESFSCDDEDECLARELMHKMTPAVLSKLRRSFKKNRDKNHTNDIDRRVEQVMRAAAAEEGIEFAAPATVSEHALCLDEDGFVNAINTIFGDHKFSTHAQKLFRLLDPFSSGRVWWRQLINRLVAVGAKKTSSRADVWKPLKGGTMRRLEHCKRETIVKLVSVEKDDSFCYVAVSKGGRVGIYSGELRLLASYEVFYHRTGVRRRVKSSWITDAIYLSDVKCFILSASDRSLTVYDATTLTHTPIFCITGLPNIPMCLAFTPMSSTRSTSELALGSERGDLLRIRFLQPRISLFYSKTPENINYYFWSELSSPPHTTYCAITTWRNVHSRTIRRVAYTRDGEILLSCSHDSLVSVRSRNVPGKLDDYLFRVQRGVTCFHIISPLHLLATGSPDGIVRLWETTQQTPFALLAAPSTPAILDVAVLAADEIVLAYCNNCTIHIWDMYEECLLQSIKLKFPFLGVLGKRVEFGTYCIHPGPARKSLSDDDSLSEPPLEVFSRRGSSVYQGSTGGLILQPETKDDWQSRSLEQEPEYIRFNRGELLFTCCDYISVVKLRDVELGELLPPPGDTLRARRPSIWELPEDMMMAPLSSPASPRSPRAPSPRLLAPSTAEFPTHDLDALLTNAGLEGILQKDFVLMQGLKQDLNRKLADMKADTSDMIAAVNSGAPYLALKTFEPVAMDPVDDMMEEYKRVMKLFPGSSVAGTPTGSQSSTLRRSPRL
ncbi:unnamed protein product [Chilo suppressalis]|uniref:WD repeat-containing protein on Y chromosome n=1 Tax=Chilo suppressalis TaxID=168631 RepID=A0ABN8B6R5_CHISP|nr:unnamed protein product [Chilo suppressalis]